MITGVDTPSVFDDAIKEQVSHNIMCAIIAAGTGVGKTTTYPCKLVKKGFDMKSKPYKVLVVLPTKEAVNNAYTRAKQNMIGNVNVNFSVGRARDGDVQYLNYKGSIISNNVTGYPIPKTDEDDTDLVFCTTGHFVNRLQEWFKYLGNEDYISPRSINVFDFVIVDEAHLRNKNMDIDIIIRELQVLQMSFPKKGVPQVVLTSATFVDTNIQRFIIKDVHPYKKDIIYYDLPGETYKEKLESIPPGLCGFILSQQVQPGIVLMFLPSMADIKKIKNGIELIDYEKRIEYVVLHSKSPEKEKELAFTPNTPGKWKLILATNIAETSLTVPNVLIIIDFPYENVRVPGANQTIRTQIQLIAKDSANQRAGRGGRTNNSLCLRLLSYQDFEKLKDTITPEIEQLPIGNELLKVLDCNIDYRFIFGDINNGITKSLSETQSKRVSSTLRELSHYGLVKNCNGHYSVTPEGKFVADLPLTNKGGLLIQNTIKAGIDIYPAIVLACMIESVDVLFNAGQIPSNFRSNIPFSTILKPWLMFCLKFGRISIPNDKISKIIDFCESNGLDYSGFRDAQKKIVSCVAIIRKKGYPVNIDVFEPEDCFIKLKDILTNMYFSYKAKKQGNNIVYVSTYEKIKHKPLILSEKFVGKVTPPDVLVSVANIEKNYQTFMILWFPMVYQPTRDYENAVELSKLESVTEYDIIEETPDEDEPEIITSSSNIDDL